MYFCGHRPADLEGFDWFEYSMNSLQHALFVHACVCALISLLGVFSCSDGQKMSKRKKNYPDPSLIVQNYGADALRSALGLNTSVSLCIFKKYISSCVSVWWGFFHLISWKDLDLFPYLTQDSGFPPESMCTLTAHAVNTHQTCVILGTFAPCP